VGIATRDRGSSIPPAKRKKELGSQAEMKAMYEAQKP
jgi:hypothetical protein